MKKEKVFSMNELYRIGVTFLQTSDPRHYFLIVGEELISISGSNPTLRAYQFFSALAQIQLEKKGTKVTITE